MIVETADLRRAFSAPARCLLIFILFWHRRDRFLRASVGDKLHAARLVDCTYPEPLAEFVNTLAAALFLLVIVLVVHLFCSLFGSWQASVFFQCGSQCLIDVGIAGELLALGNLIQSFVDFWLKPEIHPDARDIIRSGAWSTSCHNLLKVTCAG
jgi:hypothetical protein